MASHKNSLRIFVRSPELNIRSQFVTVNPSDTFFQLKRSLFPEEAFQETLGSIYFSSQGKPLHDHSTMVDSKIPPFLVLNLRIRAPGGGGDGGATGAESRDCYLNMYASKKPDKVDPNEMRLSKWTTCALSFEPLKHPCVIDRLGNIFNKEALVEGLLQKKLPKAFHHIKGLKDMISIQLSFIPGLDTGDHDIVGGTRYQCPISGLEFNGKYKFFALKKCGHVISAKALKEVKSSSCLVCHDSFSEDEKIVINGSEEEVGELRKKMEDGKVSLREKKAKRVKTDEMGLQKGVNGYGKIDDSVSAKRFKCVDMTPVNATREVYASIFTSSKKTPDFKETFTCRSLPLGRN